MKSGKPLLLILYVIIIAVLAFSVAQISKRYAESAWALSAALSSMSGLWLVYGGGALLLRLLAVIAVLILAASGMDAITTNPTWAELFGVASALCCASALFAAKLRWLGYRRVAQGATTAPLLTTSSPGNSRPAAVESSQFTLSGLFVAVTVTGILLAIVRFMDFPWKYHEEIGGALIGFVAIACFAQVASSSGCLVLGLVPAAMLLCWLADASDLLIGRTAVPYTFGIAFGYVLLHGAGYRWHWQPRHRSAVHSTESAGDS